MTKKNIFSWVPNFITFCGLISGSIAAIFAIDGHLSLAGIFIFLAALFDFLDGLAARVLKAYSALGKQLDSLTDIVAFGFAPAAILFTLNEFALFGQNQPIQDIEGNLTDWLILMSAFLIPVFSALRLAKFNLSDDQKMNFIGMPVPANAILWASLGLISGLPEYADILKIVFTAKNFLIINIATCLLMISWIPMFSFKFNTLSWKLNWYRYCFLVAGILLLLLIHIYAVPILFMAYVLSNMILYILKVNL